MGGLNSCNMVASKTVRITTVEQSEKFKSGLVKQVMVIEKRKFQTVRGAQATLVKPKPRPTSGATRNAGGLGAGAHFIDISLGTGGVNKHTTCWFGSSMYEAMIKGCHFQF